MARQALNILGRSLMDLWDNLFVIVVANLVWAVSLMPSFGVVTWLGGWPGLVAALALAVLLLAPATLALHFLTADVNRREKLEISEFWRGYRQFYRRSWLLGLLNAGFLIAAFVNIIFYSSQAVNNSPLQFITYLWFYLAFIWFSMQIYMWPLAVRMEPFRPIGLLRNTFLATFKYPLLSLILGIFVAATFVLSSLLGFVPVVLFGVGYYAIIGNKALALVLAKEKERASSNSNSTYRVEATALPAKTEAAAVFSTRSAPPGVKRRGMDD